MATKSIVIDVCDRCGSEHNRADYMKSNEWGQVNVNWNGDMGGRDYLGNGAQVKTEGKAWLCRICANDFYVFMQGVKND